MFSRDKKVNFFILIVFPVDLACGIIPCNVFSWSQNDCLLICFVVLQPSKQPYKQGHIKSIKYECCQESLISFYFALYMGYILLQDVDNCSP